MNVFLNLRFAHAIRSEHHSQEGVINRAEKK